MLIIQILKNIHEALKIPEWREIVIEEIRILEKKNLRCNTITKKKSISWLQMGIYNKIQSRWDNKTVQNLFGCKGVHTNL